MHKYSNKDKARVLLFGKSKGALALTPPTWLEKTATALGVTEQSFAFVPNSKAGRELLALFTQADAVAMDTVTLPLLLVAASTSYDRLLLEPKQKLTEGMARGFIERLARTMADGNGGGTALPHVLPRFGRFDTLEL